LAKWKPDSTNNRYEFALKFQLDDFYQVIKKAYKKSIKLYYKQKYEELIPILNLIIELNPYDIEALKIRGIAYHKTDQVYYACADNMRLLHLGYPKIDGIDCK